jgi:hypothetical protein
MKELIKKFIDNEMIKTVKSTSSMEVSSKRKQQTGRRKTRRRTSEESLVKIDASKVIQLVTDPKSNPSSEVKITMAKKVTDELLNRKPLSGGDRCRSYKRKILRLPSSDTLDRGESCDSVDTTRYSDTGKLSELYMSLASYPFYIGVVCGVILTSCTILLFKILKLKK